MTAFRSKLNFVKVPIADIDSNAQLRCKTHDTDAVTYPLIIKTDA